MPEINDIEFHLLVRGSCLGKSAFRSRRRKSMKKKNTALAGALLLVLAGWSAADAAEIYTLDPVIVTAERTDTKELKTPAAVEIMEEPDISAGSVKIFYRNYRAWTGAQKCFARSNVQQSGYSGK